MNETAKMPEKVQEEPRYRRDLPDARIERIGEHYYVKAGCQDGIFHTPEEVRAFLVEKLITWIDSEILGKNKGFQASSHAPDCEAASPRRGL